MENRITDFGFSREWMKLSPSERELMRFFMNEYPVKVSKICQEFGLEIVKSALPAKISGEIRPIEEQVGRFKIKINRFEVSARQRFTAAHELAHFLLHRDLIKDGITDTVLYRSNLSSRIEAEANRLAADILMPTNLLNDYIHKFEPDLSDMSDIQDMAEAFHVSVLAMKLRLGLE